jgi:hypothetical protein
MKLPLVPVLLLVGAEALCAAPIIREPGAIYLSDFDAPPMRLKVLGPAPAYFDFNGARYVGALRVPQSVEVQAISDRAYRVKGIAQQGQILGWVDPKYLEPIPAEVLATLRKSEERRQTVEALIAKNEVAIGMTPAEVSRSIGKPQKTTRRSSKDSAEQVWEYVKYATIPQQTNVVGPNGAVTIATTYVQTPVGRLTVKFKDNVVESLDQSEGTILTGNTTTIIAPPIVVNW